MKSERSDGPRRNDVELGLNDEGQGLNDEEQGLVRLVGKKNGRSQLIVAPEPNFIKIK